jgi:hypothetical protein
MELLERLAANELTELDSDDVPPSVGMRELAAALALYTTLSRLWLCDRAFVDADAHELAGMLARNKTLETLDLKRNNIGNDGARYLAAALERNLTLKTLDLTSNSIGSDGARHLAAALERNSVLEGLLLGVNNVAHGARLVQEQHRVRRRSSPCCGPRAKQRARHTLAGREQHRS